MDEFEYETCHISRSDMQHNSFETELIERTNALIKQGWELVAAEGLDIATTDWSETTQVWFVIRRKIGKGN